MGLNIRRWAIAFVIGVIVVVGLIETIPRSTDRFVSSLTRRQEMHMQAYGAAQQLAEFIRTSSLRDSIRREDRISQGDSLEVRVDPTYDGATRQAAADWIRQNWRRVPIDSQRYPVMIALIRDSSLSVAGFRGGRGGMRVALSLPRVGVREPCLMIIQITGQTARDNPLKELTTWSAYRNTLLTDFNVCALYARFGQPGAAMDRWLASRWIGGATQNWRGSDSLRRTQERYHDIDLALNACRSGKLDRCRSDLFDNAPFLTNARAERLVLPGRYPSDDGSSLGWQGHWVLSDMVRTLGQPAFQTLWRSDTDISATFASAAGRDIGEWTRDWAVKWYGPRAAGPVPPVSSIFQALLLTVGTLALALIRATNRRYR